MTDPGFGPLTTDRLLLRAPRPSDAGPLEARRNHPEVAALQDWAMPFPAEAARRMVEAAAAEGPTVDRWWMVTVADRADAEVVGDLALRLAWGGRAAEVGYSLDRSQWGRGYATEALSALVDWLLDQQGCTRIEGRLHPDNLRSARVLERCGFVFEGHTANSFWSQDDPSENSDDWIYGLTPQRRRDWLDRPTRAPETVELVEPYPVGLRRVLELAPHRSQDHLVAPVAHSLAQVAVPPFQGDDDSIRSPDAPRVVPWARIVLADGEPVGFVMVAEPDEADPVPYLWRLLIDRRHQGRGIGRRVVDAVVARALEWGAEALLVSWVGGVGSPGPFYEAYGFVPTGKVEDGEIEGRLDLGTSSGSGATPQ